MFRRSVALYAVVGVTACSPAAPAPPDREADEAAVREVIAGLTEAWRAGDARGWASAFTEDAHFTVWFGLRMQGREEIEWGHDLIFRDFYANTVFELEVDTIAFPARDIALALLSGRVVRADGERPDDPDAAPLAVLRRDDGGWTIVAFQNTPSAVDELRAHGDLERFKTWARGLSDPEAGEGAAR